ncbi:universal stress protein [Kitasatospora aburaviensis]
MDSSPASEQALRWAVDYAKLTGGTVHAIAAWEYPAFYGWSGLGTPRPRGSTPRSWPGRRSPPRSGGWPGTTPACRSPRP